MSIQRRECSRGEHKQYWGIEMNHARSHVYLQSYYRIDCVNHLIQNARIFYRSWKFRHSPALPGKGLAVVVVFDMYLECCDKANIILNGKLETCLTSGSSVRSF